MELWQVRYENSVIVALDIAFRSNHEVEVNRIFRSRRILKELTRSLTPLRT